MAIFTKGVPEMKAEKVTYDNTTSEFVADDVQSAIDEIDTSVDNLNAMQAVVKEYTLSATGWDTNDTYTITDSLITVGTNASTQIIGYPSEKYSDEMYEILAAANIRVISVATGEIRLKAMRGAPSISLPITITYRVGADPVTLTLDSVPTSGSNNAISSDGVYQVLNTVINIPLENATDKVGTSYNNFSVRNGFGYLILNFGAGVALTSGTEVTIYPCSTEMLNAIGSSIYIEGNAISNNNNVRVLIDTKHEVGITITPYAAISANTFIKGNVIFPIGGNY